MGKQTWTVTVSIGRHGREDDPKALSAVEWGAFRSRVQSAISEHGDELFVVANHNGGWFSEGDGYIREDAHTVVASVWADRADALVERLARLAAEYRQEAIAVTFGETLLVAPAKIPAAAAA